MLYLDTWVLLAVLMPDVHSSVAAAQQLGLQAEFLGAGGKPGIDEVLRCRAAQTCLAPPGL